MANKKLNYIVVVPSRFASTRLPGKPLIKINGLPMIIRTCLQCLKVVEHQKLYVATDNKKIQSCCKKYNIQSILTSKNCKTGTDRVAEVANKINAKTYINVQGDEPIFNPADLKKIIKQSHLYKNSVLLGYTKIKKKKDYFDVNTPKVVFDKNENLLFASRAPIPFSKTYKKNSWRQVLTYAFPSKALKKFSKLKRKSLFEKLEDIEILRFLEIGINVKLVKMSNKSHPVDTKKDLNYVKKYLNLR